MSIDRRDFLKVAGLAALGVMGKEMADVFAGEDTPSQAKKRLAMAIDMRKCLKTQVAGECHKECIKECHKVHNVPDIQDKRHIVRWIWEDKFENLFSEQEHEYIAKNIRGQNVIALCNHCDNPPCVRVCPTKATFKREADGVVMFDPHRCLGCRYCIAACPYGARSFNWVNPTPHVKDLNQKFPPRDKGVVEKCNFCEEILAADPNASPKCVERCPVQAMVFGDLKVTNSRIREVLSTSYTIRRKPGLGTNPQIYYIVGDIHD